MKSIVFDAGPIINMTLNNLLDVFVSLRKSFDGKFYICENVRKELIDKPFSGKKYKFEALQVMKLIEEKVLDVVDNHKIDEISEHLLYLANNCFSARKHPITIVHSGEIQSLACAIYVGADAVAIDERTTRMLVEDPKKLAEILSRKIHTNIKIDDKCINQLKKEIGNMKIIRSFELVTVAYEKGLLDSFIPKVEMENVRKDLLDSVLWSIKLNGCSVSEEEIKDVLKLERL